MARLTLEEFENFFQYYQGETHQMDGVGELWRRMPVDLLEESTDWIVKYRTAPVKEAKPPGAISVINAAGLQLIKEFEGLRLDAYICLLGCGLWVMARPVSMCIQGRPLRSRKLRSCYVKTSGGLRTQ